METAVEASDVDGYMHTPCRQLKSSSEDDWLEDCLDTVNVPGSVHIMLTSTMQHKLTQQTRSKDDKKSCDLIKPSSRPHSTPLTLKWLEENYEIAEGVCIPRSTLYVHYQDYCSVTDTQAVNAASFGKIIRQQFPQITTRRLGTRGQSKYHYYGIGVRETSKYYELIYSRKGIQSVSDCKREVVKQMVSYSPRCKSGTLLPEFPSIADVKMMPNICEVKITTFMVMYRTHCQRILDTVIRANFDEIQSFLIHFWQGMPSHLVSIFTAPAVSNLIAVCDSLLYQTIANVLMPSILQPLPDSLTQVINRFAKQLEVWLKAALEDTPIILQNVKFDQARRFSKSLLRLTHLNHLCQASSTVVQNTDITNQMLTDWTRIDLNGICKQILYTFDSYAEHDYGMIVTLCREFEELLHEKVPLEAYTDWLESVVNRCAVQPTIRRPERTRSIQQQFLLMWSHFTTRVIHDITLQSADSFGSFHLLNTMFTEYVLYMVEALQSRERRSDLLKALNGQEVNAQQDSGVSYQCDIPMISAGSFSTSPSMTTSSTGDVKPVHAQLVRRERQTVITDAREALAASSELCSGSSASRSHVLQQPQNKSSSVTSYDSCHDVTGRHHLTPVANGNEAQPSIQENKVMPSSHSYIDLPGYSVNPYTHYAQYGYRPRDCYMTQDWAEYQQRYGSLNVATAPAYSFTSSQLLAYESSRHSMTSSDCDLTSYSGAATGGVVAYAGSHVTKQCTLGRRVDHVAYTSPDCNQLSGNGKRRHTPTEVTSSTQPLESRGSGYLASSSSSCNKRQRTMVTPVEFNGNGVVADGFAASLNYENSFST